MNQDISNAPTPPSDFTILIVDDDPAISDLLASHFSERDIQVLTAPNGRQALEMLTHMIPDLIILDIMMPEMTGLEALQSIRADARLNTMPVIMLTSQQQQKDINYAFNTGIIDYMIKPFKPDHLIVKAEEILAATRKLVLIVEDDVAIRHQLEELYKDHGFRIVSASTGRQAWTIIESQSPNLVVVDWMLPRMEAIALLKNIHQNDNLEHMKIIVLADKEQEDGADYHPYDHIAKPFIPRDLLKRSVALMK